MTGKEKCRLLRQIRKEIAEANHIVYLSPECDYTGNDCPGTCPKCDAEIRYLDLELNRRASQGYEITLAGLSLDTYQTSVPQYTPPVLDWEIGHTVGIIAPNDPKSGDLSDWNGPAPHTPGGLTPTVPGLEEDIRILNLPAACEWWLRRENVNTLEQLRNMLRYCPLTIRREDESWYRDAMAAMKMRGLDV